MKELPPGWRRVTFGEAAETALGKMLDKGRPRGLPKVPYLRNINVQWGSIDLRSVLKMELADEERERFGLRAGDLLVCEGGEIGRAAIWRGSPGFMAYQKALHRVRPNPGTEPSFLRYQLECLANDGTLARFSTGSTIAHLPQQALRAVPIALPSVKTQRRIVAILEEHLSDLDDGLRSVRMAKQRAQGLTRSILLGLIPDPERWPERWSRKTVAAVGTVELGRQRHPDWHHGPNMRPYLRVANVFEDRIETSDVMEMHWPEGVFERFQLHPGEILLNEGQSPQYLGRPAIYRGEPEAVAFTNSLIRFIAGPEVLPEFALLVFRRHMHAGRFARESRITTNIAHLSASRLKSVEFPLPPRAEQQSLVKLAQERLEAVTRLETAIDAQAKRAEGLRRAVLAAAFSGRLTGQRSDTDVIPELAEEESA